MGGVWCEGGGDRVACQFVGWGRGGGLAADAVAVGWVIHHHRRKHLPEVGGATPAAQGVWPTDSGVRKPWCDCNPESVGPTPSAARLLLPSRRQ